MLPFSTFTLGRTLESRPMASLQLLYFFLGYFATVRAGLELECTYDYINEMFCQLTAEQCSQYTVNIQYLNKTYNCSMLQCNREQCCCSLNISFYPGDYCIVEAFNGTGKVESKTINSMEIVKPRPPKIYSVKENDGIFVVKWKTNMEETTLDPLIAEVNVSKKDDSKVVFSKEINPAIEDGLQRFEINGKKLEPDTAYVVQVRSKINWNNIYSNASNKTEFKTAPSYENLYLGLIIALSLFSIIWFVSAYTCFTRVKRKWWDIYPEPKKLDVTARKHEILEPPQITASNVWIGTPKPNDIDQTIKMLQKQREDANMDSNSCGTNPGSSDPCYGQAEPPDPKAVIEYARNKALQNWLPKNLTSSASSGINNRSYFMPLPSSLNQTMDDGSLNNPDQEMVASLPLPQKDLSSAVQVDPSYRPPKVDPNRSTCDGSRAKMLLDSGYSPNSNTVCSPDQQICAFLLPALKDNSSPVRVVLPYQQCKVDPKRSTSTETNSLSSSCSGTITGCGFESRIEAGFGKSDEFNRGMLVPLGSDCCTVIEDGYKPINKVVESDVFISEKQSSDPYQCENVNQNKGVNNIPHTSTFPGLNQWVGLLPQNPQKLHLPMMPNDTRVPIFIDSGYKCV